jgi:hypothetical protein
MKWSRAKSPLAGVEYTPSSGAYDIHRFVESDVDDAIRDFVRAFRSSTPREAAKLRAALSAHDCYTLFAFARRAALASIQRRAQPSLDDGLAAVTAVDATRIDPRDVDNAPELLAWALARAGGDHTTALTAAADRCEPEMADTVRRVAQRPASQLVPGWYRCVDTPAGPALAETDFEDFEPTVDLVTLAFSVQDVLEADAYRVSDLTVATDVPDVWLTAGQNDPAERARRRLRATLSLRAAPRDDPTPQLAQQQLLAFVAQAASAEDAEAVAAAAQSTDWYEAIGVAGNDLCCVVVANSTVVGVPTYERSGALDRFRSPLLAILADR